MGCTEMAVLLDERLYDIQHYADTVLVSRLRANRDGIMEVLHPDTER